jgi:hypothetical protein
MVLGERCMKYLVDLIFKAGTYDRLNEWFRTHILESEEIQKNAAISSIFYTFMFYSLLKDESHVQNYKRQINKCGEIYDEAIVRRILSKTARPESGNRGIPKPYLYNFMYNIYLSKILEGRPSQFMHEIFRYPEHIVCNVLSFRYNFWLLLSTFLSSELGYERLGYPNFYREPNNNETELSLDEMENDFWNKFNPQSFISNPLFGGKKKSKSKKIQKKIKKTKKSTK